MRIEKYKQGARDDIGSWIEKFSDSFRIKVSDSFRIKVLARARFIAPRAQVPPPQSLTEIYHAINKNLICSRGSISWHCKIFCSFSVCSFSVLR